MLSQLFSEVKGQIFVEVVARYARRALRLATRQQQTAYALGGEAGAKLSPHLTITTSSDTLLRLIRKTPVVAVPSSRVLGVDDRAWAKGHRYGTILVDLERHRPMIVRRRAWRPGYALIRGWRLSAETGPENTLTG